jgi:hypothetical protein
MDASNTKRDRRTGRAAGPSRGFAQKRPDARFGSSETMESSGKQARKPLF